MQNIVYKQIASQICCQNFEILEFFADGCSLLSPNIQSFKFHINNSPISLIYQTNDVLSINIPQELVCSA